VDDEAALQHAFYSANDYNGVTVFHPFMGSGTTIGEAHKLGFTAFGRDINPVAYASVRAALGPMNGVHIVDRFKAITDSVMLRIRELYRSVDSDGRKCEVLYYFWVMQAPCPQCKEPLDLFSSRVFARNAYPDRKPEVQISCPDCGNVFESRFGDRDALCSGCGFRFDPGLGTVRGSLASCVKCGCESFSIAKAVASTGNRPAYRLYAKLVLREDGTKQYLSISSDDIAQMKNASRLLHEEVEAGTILLPNLHLEPGYNTNQALNYGFANWRDFFNDRQLLALGWLRNAIHEIEDVDTRAVFATLFSGLLEFNNMFTSYKGEGTGAVRHMFSHHVLKPERTPIEANVWGTSKSSGSFSGLFRARLLRALSYRENPIEVDGVEGNRGVVCSRPFSGAVRSWPDSEELEPGAIYLSCGDSATSGLPAGSVDLVVTDPPFFDNVHYSQLADFFYAWQRLGTTPESTRKADEVQDTDASRFTVKLQRVLSECSRVLKNTGLLVFTYHHSRDEGWESVAEAIYQSGFVVVNAQPIKAEMSVAMPKVSAKEPIQLDIILVCRKRGSDVEHPPLDEALARGQAKLSRLMGSGLQLSRNDKRIVLFGQALTSICTLEDVKQLGPAVDDELSRVATDVPARDVSVAFGTLFG